MSIFLDRTKEFFLKKNLWPLLKKHCPWRALTFLQMIGHLCLCLLTAVEFSDQALLQIFGQKYICVLRAKGGGGEAASSPDELTGNRTRESPTVPAGDHSPEEQTLSAGERNGWSRSVSYYFYVNHKYIHLLSGTITQSIVKKIYIFFFSQFANYGRRVRLNIFLYNMIKGVSQNSENISLFTKPLCRPWGQKEFFYLCFYSNNIYWPSIYKLYKLYIFVTGLVDSLFLKSSGYLCPS